jgi:uncharacterized protein DUF5681
MPDNPESKYQVGFQRPPRHTQFRKGTSGNPKGRPREAKNLAAVLEEALAETVAIVENGRRRKITKRCAMIKQLVNKAASGDLRASRQLTDLEFRLNPEGVRQKSALELMRELAQATLKAEEAEAREQSVAEHAGLQELENVSDRESGPAADVDEWLRKS